jgi:hypothetical protein
MTEKNVNRFAIDLSDVSEERLLIPAGVYPVKIAKAVFLTGEKDDKNWGAINLTLIVKDEAVQELLGIDESKTFYNLFINFDKETEAFLHNNNPDFGILLKICDLKSSSDIFNEGTEEADSQWEYNKIFFNNICKALPGYDLLANVVQKTNRVDKEKMDNLVTKLAKLEE